MVNMKKLIQADTIDAAGNVWETTGENIRRGSKEFSEDTIKEIVDILFPVGSIYCGENAFILSVGKWQPISQNAGRVLLLGGTVASGNAITTDKIMISDTETARYTMLRMYRRDS
jgi:hypothetical protein